MLYGNRSAMDKQVVSGVAKLLKSKPRSIHYVGSFELLLALVEDEYGVGVLNIKHVKSLRRSSLDFQRLIIQGVNSSFYLIRRKTKTAMPVSAAL